MRTEIPIGQTGVIDGITVKAVAPQNQIWLCHGCHFVDMEEIGACKTEKAVCRLPDRIFKRVETTN